MPETAKRDGRNRKLSEIIAAQLMEEIRSRGWPVGESLGTEAELMARYDVSRATIAEAVRQVERYGAAIMRRGSGGGLVVTNSARAALSRTISTYLELSNVSVSEQYEAARLIETEAARAAAETITEEQICALRQSVLKLAAYEDNVSLHRAAMQIRQDIAEACGVRAVLLLMRSLARVLTHYVRPDLRTLYRDREFEHGVVADLSGVVEAIVAGDAALAAHYVRRDVERREARARELHVAHPSLEGGPLRRETPSKLAEKIAYAIRDDIARMGWRTGERLGDEAELLRRYDVSLWVLRQAVRILEPSEIVKVRRGQGGGIYIGRPSPAHTVEIAVSYLTAYRLSTGIPLTGYLQTRRALYQEMAQFAAKRATLEERERLLRLAKERPGEASLDDGTNEGFWSLIGTMSRNQVLNVFGAILNSFIAASAEGSRCEGPDALRLLVVEAIRDGDGPLAQRRMGTYLRVGGDNHGTGSREDPARS
jgi:DNA-binding FadR family transcriptional regulator